jgi:hypothetical protein
MRLMVPRGVQTTAKIRPSTSPTLTTRGSPQSRRRSSHSEGFEWDEEKSARCYEDRADEAGDPHERMILIASP